jgi:hypothetical protein
MRRARSLALVLLLATAGCDRTDPYTRAGAWRPNNANEANLRAMIAVPSDLVLATPASRPDGGLAAAAVARLRHDTVRPLPDSGLAQIVTVGTAQPAPPQPVPPPPAAPTP